MITVASVFSGSSGNCTLIRTENTAVLVDAGKNCKAVREGLASFGLDLDSISAIFVTHEHSDHISALDVMSKRQKTPIHITEPSASELCKKCAAAECAVIHRGLIFEEKVGDLIVHSFPLPHDSAAHVGYVFTDSEGDRAAVATDMGFATCEAFENLRGCRQIVIEANHDVNMLKYGPYPDYLKRRILSKFGHLSNEGCAELCIGLAGEGCESFLLAHLSRENNTPELAMKAVRGGLDLNGFASVKVKVAPPASPLIL